ncbi:MAG: GrpB family protein [Spirochaetales bacterium]|jgi:GrpB-like predicted nucleotidyltransferase (UPF0157 family)|nr:GrpB family protein [Spirochaetales bacterium]
MNDPIALVPYDPQWQSQFLNLGYPIREAMGDVALRIDHIGSTSIPGILAKPVIDIQISVDGFEPFDGIRDPLEALRYRWCSDNPDLSKRYFREPVGEHRIHIHVRKLGSWQQQLSLLFRDYLRTHNEECREYERVKVELAKRFRNERGKYVDGKDPIIWEILCRATKWVQRTCWEPGSTDV